MSKRGPKSAVSHGANIKLNDAGEEYMAQRRGELRPIDGGERHPVLRRFAASVGNIQVRHLSPTHVDQWFFGDKGLVRTATERASFNNYRKRVNGFMRSCARRGWLPYGPDDQPPGQARDEASGLALALLLRARAVAFLATTALRLTSERVRFSVSRRR